MTRVRIVLVIAAFALSACGAGRESASADATVKPTVHPTEPLRSPTGVPAPSAELTTLEACQLSSADGLDRVVAVAIDGLRNTTSEDGWSMACARVLASDASDEPHIVSVRIGWMGTLHQYAVLPGANPIVGLADQAYAFDDGSRIALRSGEIVAVVAYSGGTRSDTEALARQVAEQLPE